MNFIILLLFRSIVLFLEKITLMMIIILIIEVIIKPFIIMQSKKKNCQVFYCDIHGCLLKHQLSLCKIKKVFSELNNYL